MIGRSNASIRAARFMTAALACSGMPAAMAAQALGGDVRELGGMSLEELAQVEVTSVSKAAQALSSAPAAIYVITRDEILRSGVLTIPEALRLAPNLQVAQLGASTYTITARGFGDQRESQTQANKLLILVDGRTVYSPLFSGVLYDVQDVLMDEIERIEVISGPGASLWGANAMNGVINIITRSASSSQGVMAKVGGGNRQTALAARYGSRIGDAAYRVYAKRMEHGSLELDEGSSARDRWRRTQVGFRSDWSDASNALTLQGDGYRLDQSAPGLDEITGKGGNVLARWDHLGERSHWRVQVYYDRSDREAPPDGAAFELDTYDLEIQQRFELGAHRIVWGVGKRTSDYRFKSFRALQFSPAARDLDLTTAFAQDTIDLGAVELTLGLKLEDNPFTDWTALPDVRLSYQLSEHALVWAAASRAIRAPTPFDVDVREYMGDLLFVAGNPDVRSERLTAFQLGYRHQPNASISLSITGFYHDYERLRTIEPTPPTIIPLRWDNNLGGNTYGVEAWASFQITPWWRISPSFRLLHKRLKFEHGASGLLGVEQSGNDPRTQASIKSSMNLGRRITFDAMLRYVDDLPAPPLSDDYELSARLAWDIGASLQLSLAGFNLLHDRHLEYPTPTGHHIQRSVFAELRWQY